MLLMLRDAKGHALKHLHTLTKVEDWYGDAVACIDHADARKLLAKLQEHLDGRPEGEPQPC